MAFLAKHPLLTYIDVRLKRILPNISENEARQQGPCRRKIDFPEPYNDNLGDTVFWAELRHRPMGDVKEVEPNNNMIQRTVQSAWYILATWASKGQTSALPILPTLPVSRIPIGTPPYTRKRQRGANIQVEQDDTQPGVITSITSVPTVPQQNIVAEEPTIPSPVVGTEGASPSNLPFLVYKHSITLVRGYFLPRSSLVLVYSLD